MDVRAKHGRCFLCQLARCFAPRHLNRWAFRGLPNVIDLILLISNFFTLLKL